MVDAPTTLIPGEFVVEDDNEKLFRQVHPKFLDTAGTITSQVFELNSGDAGMLSVTRSSIVSAAKATTDYIESGLASAGVVALTVGEANSEDAPAIDDSEARTVPDGHAYLDFRSSGLPKGKARRLKNVAASRDWAYQVS